MKQTQIYKKNKKEHKKETLRKKKIKAVSIMNSQKQRIGGDDSESIEEIKKQ